MRSSADLAAHSAIEQLDAPGNAGLRELAPYSEMLKRILGGSEEGSSEEHSGLIEVTEEAGDLYGLLEQADAGPAALEQAATHNRYEAMETLAKWRHFREHELPALNQKLRQTHRAEIDLHREPEDMPQSGDEEANPKQS